MQLLKLNHLNHLIFSTKGRYLAYGLLMILTLLLLNSIINTYRNITAAYQNLQLSQSYQENYVRLDDLSLIAKAHLFGAFEQNTLPQTALNIKLVGVMLASPPKYSQVIISMPDGSEKLFNLNETLPGQAKIIKITADYIIIEHDSKKEILSLPQNKLIFSNKPAGLEFNHE